jgi:hypothetical protein
MQHLQAASSTVHMKSAQLATRIQIKTYEVSLKCHTNSQNTLNIAKIFISSSNAEIVAAFSESV